MKTQILETLTTKPVTIRAGFGYWNTTRYPRGGDFRRSDGSVSGTIARAVSHFSDGSIDEVEIALPAGRAVVKLAYLIES